MKTNAMRLLDTLKLPYSVLEYIVDPNDLNAASVAAKMGVPEEQLFKTLVGRGDRTGVILAVVPSNAEVDLKALAQASGNRKVELVALKEVQPLTGYIRGGVTALACKKRYPVYLHETARALPKMVVSAGMRGLQLVLLPEQYAQATQAQYATIGRTMR